MNQSILLQTLSPDQFTELITNIFRTELSKSREVQQQPAENDLITRSEVLTLLKINPATLWRYQNLNKVIVYKIANKCYYKRSEIMATINQSKL